MKEVFRSCLITSLVTVFILAGGFYAIWQWGIHDPPVDFKYVEQLEFIAGKPLPSCKVLSKKYKEERYSIAIFALNEEDYQKVLKGIEYSHYTYDANTDFETLTKKMYFKKDIGEGFTYKFKSRYDGGEFNDKFGFKYPYIVMETKYIRYHP